MSRIKLLTFFLFLLGSCFLSGCSLESDPVVYDNHGNAVQLSKLRGKWVVVNYWADWCEACRAETKDLNQFYQHSANKDYVIFGINYGTYSAVSQDDAIKAAGIAFPVLRENPGAAWGMSTITVLPTTFIIDPDGKVVKTLLGPHTEHGLLDIIHQLKTT